MTNLQQIVTDFLNESSHASELMYEPCKREWDNTPYYDYVPFEFRSVASYGGEDCGSDYYNVIEVRLADNPDETLLVKLQGWYASYNGADYESWSFVQPVQKTITVYQ